MVMLLTTDEEVVMVQDQPLDVGDLVEGLAGDLLDLVVGQVDHFKDVSIVDDAEDVPVQERDVVAVEH